MKWSLLKEWKSLKSVKKNTLLTSENYFQNEWKLLRKECDFSKKTDNYYKKVNFTFWGEGAHRGTTQNKRAVLQWAPPKCEIHAYLLYLLCIWNFVFFRICCIFRLPLTSKPKSLLRCSFGTVLGNDQRTQSFLQRESREISIRRHSLWSIWRLVQVSFIYEALQT